MIPRTRWAFDKEESEATLLKYRQKICALQNLLYAEKKHALLIVLQGIDAAGKDGAVRNVFSGINPQGCQVSSFKAPTESELSHDFLWRIHKAVPEKGMVAVFNRSHYEDVLIARVHDIVPKEVWKKRYDHINDFLKMPADNGTVIIKFFLHVSKEEQKERLKKRLEYPTKLWKYNPEDAKERKHWNAYIAAYEEAIQKCHTPWAPWYVVPCDRKWVRNLVIAQITTDTLEGLKMKFPKPKDLPKE